MQYSSYNKYPSKDKPWYVMTSRPPKRWPPTTQELWTHNISQYHYRVESFALKKHTVFSCNLRKPRMGENKKFKPKLWKEIWENFKSQQGVHGTVHKQSLEVLENFNLLPREVGKLMKHVHQNIHKYLTDLVLNKRKFVNNKLQWIHHELKQHQQSRITLLNGAHLPEGRKHSYLETQ